jgi:copper chaperone NosL
MYPGKMVYMIPLLRCLLPALVLWMMAGVPGYGGDQAQSLSGKDKCPVCGMFVAKYPDWTAKITFRGASTVYFDGPKDLFTYYLNLGKYNPAQSPATVTAIQVKDYYSLKWIDGRKAVYVFGSDVYGPMGKELIPFEKAADAQGFMNDHKGKKVVRIDEITPALLKKLE